jgi:hypothetical protein
VGDEQPLPKVAALIVASFLAFGGAMADTSGEKAEAGIATMALEFPWAEYAVPVNYSLGYETFVYTSAYTLDTESWHKVPSLSLFKYFEEGLRYGKGSMVIFDPGPPGGENNTFLDLYFNTTLMAGLEDYLCDVIENLGISSFVLGDEWPRGLSREEVTVQKLVRYNETYHGETGRWMRADPVLEEKKSLADWFYGHSVEAWNALAGKLRRRFPDAHMGTNVDLVWEPDYTGSDVADWRSTDSWGKVDLAPYDFVVTHYYSKLGYDPGDSENLEMRSDDASISVLRDALASLLHPVTNTTGGLEVFLLLGAHCNYPYVITPMQMVGEWNTALEFKDQLAGVGWFTWDLWPMGDRIVSRSMTNWENMAPMKENRLSTMRRLGRLSIGPSGGGEQALEDSRLFQVTNLAGMDNPSNIDDLLSILSGGNLDAKISITFYQHDWTDQGPITFLKFPRSSGEAPMAGWESAERGFEVRHEIIELKEVPEVQVAYSASVALLVLLVLAGIVRNQTAGLR